MRYPERIMTRSRTRTFVLMMAGGLLAVSYASIIRAQTTPPATPPTAPAGPAQAPGTERRVEDDRGRPDERARARPQSRGDPLRPAMASARVLARRAPQGQSRARGHD